MIPAPLFPQKRSRFRGSFQRVEKYFAPLSKFSEL